ncbi:DUF1493 family protein [Paraburkholderia bannensis]|uniref:DUF1493 family protein n=1 Tax=Paraburkholderia bannensis TaxID=765414 RepID=UPI0004837B7D|nr:DUF1493 family protein [Paraburkholderia bannensis]
MTQQREASDDLGKFIKNEIGLSENKKILATDVIEDNYGSTGDDADKFMNNFFNHFSISRGDYDFHRYFEMEGSGFPIPFFGKWYMRKILKVPEYVREQLTVRMLQHAIDLGIWDSQRLREMEDPPAQE